VSPQTELYLLFRTGLQESLGIAIATDLTLPQLGGHSRKPPLPPFPLHPPPQAFLFNLVALPGSHSVTANLSNTKSSFRDIIFFKFHENRAPDKDNRGFSSPFGRSKG